MRDYLVNNNNTCLPGFFRYLYIKNGEKNGTLQVLYLNKSPIFKSLLNNLASLTERSVRNAIKFQ